MQVAEKLGWKGLRVKTLESQVHVVFLHMPVMLPYFPKFFLLEKTLTKS
jgi:hypothetical protein